jgi:large subunit ribosomal protein L4
VASKLKQMGLESVLLITDTVDETLFMASRNLQSIAIVEPEYTDPLSLVYFDRVLMTRGALARVEELLS